MRVIVLRGIPGSGKSRYALNLVRNERNERVHIVSADHYFDRGLGYKFDPTKLGAAHGQCLRRYSEYVADASMTTSRIVMVVDNTNMSVVEMAPYMELAAAFRVPAEIIEFPCLVETAVQRNIHNVPRAAIEHMESIRARETLNMPARWKHRLHIEEA